MKEVNANLTIQLFMGAILILLSIVLIVFFIGKLIKPLIDLQSATETLTTGKLDLKLVKARGDEIGSLANAFQVMVVKLKEIVSGIHTGSSQIFIGSRQISDSAQTISQGASQQASATEQVASSIEEVISAINQNSENAQHAKTIAKRAEKGIIESQQASLNTIEAMKKIAEKTTIITGIAQKTNILAINAAIEAARAGSMGKGFGIVAAEVRNLAESSHLAADDIVKLSDQTLIMSEESGKILSGIVPDVQKTSLLIEEIANASMEQNSGVKQISQAIEQLNSITLQNSATSEELASGSEELVSQAETLKKAVAFFRMESDDITELSLNKEDIPENEISESQYFDLADKDHKLKNNLIPEFKKDINKGLNPDQKGFNLNLDNKTDDDFESF
jgi:methyl-accepting chemotaxis protein